MFERFFALRNVYIIAVISLFAGALLMFVVGAERTALAFSACLTNFNAGELRAHLDQGSLASVGLVQTVDAFLFALVLLIFSYGIYTLFVSNLKDTGRAKLPRCSTLRASAISRQP